ncbi:ADP-glyceromanno-heptose 6-epimerase [Sphingobacteriales bacterium UPWRP_1]|nr:ADP-glyceromanno-heptose 6-epimerase [Sphingobacteriales bacterium TSM_CSM]PSJ77868.1 ADP-glyceromanno-heptose 6-epimerase [Sphingobacteriales bacterium UPWRP_1]
MLVITGAAGFIGSCLTALLNEAGRSDLILVDDFSDFAKRKNVDGKQYAGWVHRDAFFGWVKSNHQHINGIYHLGARTDTTDFSTEIFDRLNLGYSKKMWQVCTEYQIPLVYASSAATYGNGNMGYDDNHLLPRKLKPLNPYALSKNNFDVWALEQENTPPAWFGLKFFNVYGPNEYHKKRMASVVFHAFNQIRQSGSVKLFRSHRPDVEDGQQLRDFVYVKDVVTVCQWMMQYQPENGLYNVGTGTARSFTHLANAVFMAMNLNPVIEFIDMPTDIRATYQYFTEANMNKLALQGYYRPFTTLEEGVFDYVTNYLLNNSYW